MNTDNIICEFGTNYNINFANPKLYDSDNKEIIIPTCECGLKKCCAIGNESYMWFCFECGNKESP